MYFMDSEKLFRFPVFYRTLYFFVSIAPIIVIATSSPAAERREAAGQDVFFQCNLPSDDVVLDEIIQTVHDE